MKALRGISSTPEYRAWHGINSRCHNERNGEFHRYGGRGIYVCQRRRKGTPNALANFLADMGPRPSPAQSLDRLDNDAGYCPDNCRWATGIEQQNNTRKNHWIEFGGRRQTIAQWARELGVPPRVEQVDMALQAALATDGEPPA